MDKLSDYLPLLIILVSVLFSIVGKKKKKTVTYETTLPGKIPEKNKPVEVRIRPEKEKINPIFSPQKQKTVATQNLPVAETEEESEDAFFNVSDLDEVKKAIIYTEIFNKKEYN